MVKVINFLEAKNRLNMAGLVSALKWEQNREKPVPEATYTGPKKRPCIVSALPGETIPPEFLDFRPLLQRDGLILLGWARRDTAPYRGMGKGPCYTVDWITSAPNRHHRRYTAGFIFQNEMGAAKPDSSGGPYFFQGIHGKPSDLRCVQDRDVADYVFACAPWDLNRRTIPGFIEELKAAGVTVDFGFPYSMDYVKKLEFVAALRECKVVSPRACVWGKVEL